MKKQIIIALGVIILILGFGGKWYMDREKDKQELLEVQTDLANYIYNNYNLFSENQEKSEQLSKEFNNGQGNLTTKEYLERGLELREYSDIKKIEFTKFSVTPMNTVEVYFKINNAYEDSVPLDTISAETGKRIYKINSLNEVNSYYLERKNEPTEVTIPKDKIIYYEGGID